MTFYTAATKKSAPVIIQSTSSAAKNSANAIGRTFSNIGYVIKATSIKVKNAIIQFFKNVPNYLKTGIGVGILGTVIGLSGLITTQLAIEKYKTARIILTIFFSAVLFASAAIMFAFGKNPIVIK